MADDNNTPEENQTESQSNDFDAQVLAALDTIRPALQMDGGDCEYLGSEDGFVKIRLVGACGNCPSSTMTLQFGIEQTLKEKVPGVKGVIPV